MLVEHGEGTVCCRVKARGTHSDARAQKQGFAVFSPIPFFCCVLFNFIVLSRAFAYMLCGIPFADILRKFFEVLFTFGVGHGLPKGLE